jgi:hypothetical protein
MAESDPQNFDMKLIVGRMQVLNDAASQACFDIQRHGRLMVPLEKAFSTPEDLLRLIARICVLKIYAEAAATQFGTPMGLPEWSGFFERFADGVSVMPKKSS